MSTLPRTLRNLRKVGIKDYFTQMLYIGDTKAGTYMGKDRAGNKYFENGEELPLRTRWVEYAKHDYDVKHCRPKLERDAVEKVLERVNESRELVVLLKGMRELFAEAMKS
ncbi:hypothetical protein NLG97_g9967 [Lecanicillium saksenae]|uniref:Uncharacterized protein n=1 Tax=Lecanicillium saksenae TaxID=468837 RepID=A0ACC1QEI3_9HYPO|nr:hypothetical protein NLG97_g9967 [Lecanicillium saksenae]